MADALPSDVSKVDPADAWKLWRPSAAIPWGPKWVAHLYRRAAFGPSPADTERALTEGFPRTLDRLLAGEPGAADQLELLTETGQYYSDASQLRAWWLYSMIESGHPLREKLTLFWHNHFATSYAKVRSSRLMFEQNLILRKHALGAFRPFLLDMSRDTAMLVWLDSNRNVNGAPNENFAREVMELFSLGVGNYSEKDIQEAARAFTGWHHDPEVVRYEYNPDLHDSGPKTVFGQTGNWGGDDIVRLCCDRPSCAKFLVGKLYAFLVSETPPPKGLLAPLEERFRGSNYDIAELVRTMLGSAIFFSAHAYRKRIKWPAEYILGTVRAVVPDRVPLSDLVDPLAKMGQVLFAPPNVKGWRTGTDWLNSATLLARNNFAETVASGRWSSNSDRNSGGTTPTAPPPKQAVIQESPEQQAVMGAIAGGAVAHSPVRERVAPDGTRLIFPVEVIPPKVISDASPPPDAKFDPLEVVFRTKPTTLSALIQRMGVLLYGEEVSPAARTKIEKFLIAGKKPPSAKDFDSVAFRQKAREALQALMCLAEYQLS